MWHSQYLALFIAMPCLMQGLQGAAAYYKRCWGSAGRGAGAGAGRGSRHHRAIFPGGICQNGEALPELFFPWGMTSGIRHKSACTFDSPGCLSIESCPSSCGSCGLHALMVVYVWAYVFASVCVCLPACASVHIRLCVCVVNVYACLPACILA